MKALKSVKTFIALALALVLVLSLIPTTVLKADEGITTSAAEEDEGGSEDGTDEGEGGTGEDEEGTDEDEDGTTTEGTAATQYTITLQNSSGNTLTSIDNQTVTLIETPTTSQDEGGSSTSSTSYSLTVSQGVITISSETLSSSNNGTEDAFSTFSSHVSSGNYTYTLDISNLSYSAASSSGVSQIIAIDFSSAAVSVSLTETYTVTVSASNSDSSSSETGGSVSVTYNDTVYESGSVTVASGGSVTLNITPSSGYNVDSVKVGDEDKTSSLQISSDYTYFTYALESITSDTSVTVTFSEIETISGDSVSNYVTIPTASNSVTDSGSGTTTYYYQDSATITGAAVSGSTENSSYKILTTTTDEDGNTTSSYSESYTVSESTTSALTLTVYDPVNLKWYYVNTGITFVIDKTDPTLTVDNTNSDKSWSKGSFTISGSVLDSDSGIQTVYYTIGSSTDSAGTLSVDSDGKFSLTVSATENNDIDTTYTIYAVDNSGRTTSQAVYVMVDATAPAINSFSVSYSENSTVQNVIKYLTFGTFFNNEVTITVSVSDTGSGASKVYLYETGTDENGNTTYTQVGTDAATVSDGTATFTISKEYFDETLCVVAEDAVGNKTDYTSPTQISSTIKSNEFMLEYTDPTISVSYANAVYTDSSSNKWYSGDVAFTVTLKDEAGSGEDNYSGINNVSITINGETISTDTNSQTIQTSDPESKISSLTYYINTSQVTAASDGKYVLSITVTDNAGNSATQKETVYIDTASPSISSIAFSDESGTTLSENPSEYGYYFDKSVTVTVTASDTSSSTGSSGVKSITYKAVSSDGSSVISETTATADSSGKITFNLPADFKGFVYAYATDNVNNTDSKYVSPDGVILETASKHSEETHITFSYDKEDYYSSNVPVTVTVTDTYSGIASIEWSVTSADSSNDQEGTESGWTKVSTDSNLVTSYKKTITVKSNSNNVVLKVKMTDNAGNTTTKSITLNIDKSDPEISVSYDNNSADSSTYFNANRTATITISERNLDTDDVVITVTKDGSSYSVGNLTWTKKSGSGNGDNTTWTTTITYSSDGDYTFAVSATDLAGNKSGSVDYGSSAAPTSFTIDKTDPVISVTYSNNDVSNSVYFAAARTMTITITEHNFDSSRVTFTYTKDGTSVSPSLSWSTSGDVHTATITFGDDGDYEITALTVTDKAGNTDSGVSYGSSAAATSFTIDTTTYSSSGTGIIGGVKNGVAYRDEVIPTIYFEDTNYDYGSLKITLTQQYKGETIVWTQDDDFLKAFFTETESGASGEFDLFELLEEYDGIYTLYVEFYDLAGNMDSDEVTFTVNRYGSVYVYEDYLVELIEEDIYVQLVEGDLVITEYNPNKLVEDSLVFSMTLDGKDVESPSYTVEQEINDEAETGESGWYEYTYTIDEENFSSDGVYKITVYTVDEAENSSQNIDLEEYDNIVFYVDTTTPEITSAEGLEKSIVNADSVEVSYTVYDAIALESIEVTVDGEVVAAVSDEDLEDDYNNYTGTFTIGEGADQEVVITITDKAGNVLTTADESFSPTAYTFNKTITVSTNFFIRWYANKPLFWGSIGAIIVIIALIIFFILFKRRKDDDEEEAQTA